jgi:hypothetical protein
MADLWDNNPQNIIVDDAHSSLLDQYPGLNEYLTDRAFERSTLQKIFSPEIEPATEEERVNLLKTQEGALYVISNLVKQPKTQQDALSGVRQELTEKTPIASHGAIDGKTWTAMMFVAHLWNENEAFFNRYYNYTLDQGVRGIDELTPEERASKSISGFVKQLVKDFHLVDESGQLDPFLKSRIEG